MKSVQVKRKTKIVWTIVGFLVASLSLSFYLTYAGESSCVKCHTSEKLLQTLHKPVKVAIEAGEG